MENVPSLFVLGSFVVACSAKVADLPRPGESLRASAFTVEPGGKGLNLAVGAHRLGARVDGIFAIGNDLFSQLAAPTFLRAGLSTSMLRSFDANTGSGIGFTDARGENCLAVHLGANLLLSAREIRFAAEAVQRADLILAQFEIGDEPILEAFAIARQAGRRTLLNPSPFRPLDPRILQQTSILVLNRVEAAHMAQAYALGAGEEESRKRDLLAMALLERGPDLVITTLGGDGAVGYARGGIPIRQPAFRTDVIDTLGAGDAFTVGLATSLQEGRSVVESLERAAACGALVCQGLGVFNRLPSSRELQLFLDAQNRT